MRQSLFTIVFVLGFTSWALAQFTPIKPGQYAADPAAIAKRVDLSCPIKGTYSIRYKAVGGAVIDKDVTIYNGEVRYCKTEADVDFCKKNNPTQNIPCKLLDPLIPRGIVFDLCPQTDERFVDRDKHIGVKGGWSILDKKTTIRQTVYTCRRAYAADSCRYWLQSSALTLFKNQGLFSVDRVINGDMSGCTVDDEAEAAFQAAVTKSRPALTGLLDVKKNYWLGKCPASNATCVQQVGAIWRKAAIEAHGRLAGYPYDGSPFEMMKHITKTYDPVVDKEIAKYPKISNFPSD